MYLTKISVPTASRRGQQLLRDCQQLHRFVCGLFASGRKEGNLLFRTQVQQGMLQLYIYSDSPVESLPEGVTLLGQRELSDWLSCMEAGQLWGFDLIAAPSKKVYRQERDKNSQRRALRLPRERQEWLQQKGQQNGFSLISVQEQAQSRVSGSHNRERGGGFSIEGFHFQGVLQIGDAEAFRKAVAGGIGPGRAYGMGMLLLKKL